MSRKKNILVVDDSSFDRKLIKGALEKKVNCHVFEAESGDQCFKMIENEKIHLLLLDVLMPKITGTQVLQKIRKKYNALDLPIIMISAKGETTDVVDSLKGGANDYITKPVNFEVATSRVQTHLMLSELSLEMTQLKEIAALDAMITTYNHEINNPLSVVIGTIGKASWSSPEDGKRCNDNLWRIADIVKKIREVTTKKEVEYSSYDNTTKMLKIK